MQNLKAVIEDKYIFTWVASIVNTLQQISRSLSTKTKLLNI